MSTYNKSGNRSGELNRSNNRQAQQQPQSTQKKLNRKDMDSACYRLSRVPQKYSMTKAVKSENSESFAVTYYQSNPVDTRTMQEKLEEIESKINDSNLEEDEKFTLLVQRKALNTMIYGENSPESIRAATDFGSFYNSLEKPDSALRNLSKAYAASKQTELSEEDAFLLAVELADASLNSSQPSKEKHKQIVTADNALTPYAEREEGTAQIIFRKDICLARLRAYRQKFEEAVSYYEKALSEYAAYKEAEKQQEKEGNNGEEEEKAEKPENSEKQETNEEEEANDKDRDIIEPNLYVEAADIAERANNTDKSNEWYKTAYDMYLDRGYKKAASRIEDKVPKEGGIGEEEEEEAMLEEEGVNEKNNNENCEEGFDEQPEEEKQEEEKQEEENKQPENAANGEAPPAE